jgi:hypothetical protein
MPADCRDCIPTRTARGMLRSPIRPNSYGGRKSCGRGPCLPSEGPSTGFGRFRPSFVRLAEFRLWGRLGPLLRRQKSELSLISLRNRPACHAGAPVPWVRIRCAVSTARRSCSSSGCRQNAEGVAARRCTFNRRGLRASLLIPAACPQLHHSLIVEHAPQAAGRCLIQMFPNQSFCQALLPQPAMASIPPSDRPASASLLRSGPCP